MANADTGQPANGGSFWSRVPDYWKFITLLIAIGGTAVAGYAKVDEIRDALFAADADITKRLDSLSSAMVRRSDLDGFILVDRLNEENCRQTLLAQKHEFKALVTAYDELIEAMRLAESSFANRELADPEMRQFQAVITLRSGYQSRRRDMERQVSVLDERIQLTEGC